MSCASQNIIIKRGETFSDVLTWGTTPFISKAITGITAACPPVITAPSHAVPDGWRVAIVAVQGMTEINADVTDLRRLIASDFNKATVLSSSTISLTDVNAGGYSAYASGGYLVFYTPHSLSGYTARMQIRENALSEDFILELTTENGGIALDDTLKTITRLIDADDTAAITQDTAVYDLELISGTGVVTRLVQGSAVIDGEITR